MSGIQVSVQINTREEVSDLLESAGWDCLMDVLTADALQSRKALLTSFTMDEPRRIRHQAKLETYKYWLDKVYSLSGHKLPRKYRELLTGSEEE